MEMVTSDRVLGHKLGSASSDRMRKQASTMFLVLSIVVEQRRSLHWSESEARDSLPIDNFALRWHPPDDVDVTIDVAQALVYQSHVEIFSLRSLIL